VDSEQELGRSVRPDIEKIILRVAGKISRVVRTEKEEDWAGRDYWLDCGGIAGRIRRPDVRYRYRDVTIRSWVRSGATTELQKWIAGKVDWLVYGWTDEQAVSEWIVVSIPHLIVRGLYRNRQLVRNRDKLSAFIAIPVDEIIQAGLLIDGVLTYPSHVSRYGTVHPVHPVPRCPKCRGLWQPGPKGLPQLECLVCSHVWTPRREHQDPALRAVMEDPLVRAALDKLQGLITEVIHRPSGDETDEKAKGDDAPQGDDR
jgi:hypothetical protein